MIINILPEDDSKFFIELVAHIKSPIAKIKALEEFKNNNFEPTKDITTKLSEENKALLNDYLTNHQETLIFALMTQNKTIKLQQPIKNSPYSVITRITPDDYTIQYTSIINNDYPELETDLTTLDIFNENDISNNNPSYIKSYIYGDPFNEDFTLVKKTSFTDITNMISNECEK